MRLLISIGIRFFTYIVVLLPILRGIFSGLGWFGIVPALILLVIIASILEARKIMAKLVDFVLDIFKLSPATGDSKSSNIIDEIIQAVVIECDSCGTQVKLRLNKGKCEACGKVY